MISIRSPLGTFGIVVVERLLTLRHFPRHPLPLALPRIRLIPSPCVATGEVTNTIGQIVRVIMPSLPKIVYLSIHHKDAEQAGYILAGNCPN